MVKRLRADARHRVAAPPKLLRRCSLCMPFQLHCTQARSGADSQRAGSAVRDLGLWALPLYPVMQATERPAQVLTRLLQQGWLLQERMSQRRPVGARRRIAAAALPPRPRRGNRRDEVGVQCRIGRRAASFRLLSGR